MVVRKYFSWPAKSTKVSRRPDPSGRSNTVCCTTAEVRPVSI